MILIISHMMLKVVSHIYNKHHFLLNDPSDVIWHNEAYTDICIPNKRYC